jgi:hypothetical protein
MIEILMFVAPETWATTEDLAAQHGGEWGALTVRQVVRRLAKIYAHDEYLDMVPEMSYMNIVARDRHEGRVGSARRYRVKPSLYYRVTHFRGSLARGRWSTVTAGGECAAGNSASPTTAKAHARRYVATRRWLLPERGTIEIVLSMDGGGAATCKVRREHGVKIQHVSYPMKATASESG